MYHDQDEFPIRCEWGIEAVNRLAPTSDAVIIVDVISFTTCVDVAVSRGGRVYPYRWRDERAFEFARAMGALLANASRKDPNGFSLSPYSMLKLSPGASVVVPSPNGATLSLATGDAPTFAGCLRNAQAVAVAAATAAAASGERITIIPAGERWEDGSLRPALEDWLGAGAVIAHLPAHLQGSRSPEAEAAAAAFLHLRERLFETLAACGSGKEAIDRGSIEDIRLAADLNASLVAPRLVDGAFQG